MKHSPTLLSWVLIYFHINPLLRCLTCKVTNVTPRCQQTDSSVSWHRRSEAGQYCAVCRCDATPVAWGDGHGQAIGPPSWVINHRDDRNSGLYIRTHSHNTYSVCADNSTTTRLHKHTISPFTLTKQRGSFIDIIVIMTSALYHHHSSFSCFIVYDMVSSVLSIKPQ